MDALRVMGIDPGFASLGVAVLEQRAGAIQVLAASVLRTKKASQKTLRDLRVSADDLRRVRFFWDNLDIIARLYKPQAVAVETYAPQPGRTGGNAWKAAVAYGMSMGLGLSLGVPVLPFLPGDLKQKLAHKASASKEAVADAVLGQVSGLEVFLSALPAGQREHATDAVGHALLGLREMIEMRQMMGVAAP